MTFQRYETYISDYNLVTEIGQFRGSIIKDINSQRSLCYRFVNIRYAKPLVSRWRHAEAISSDYYYNADCKSFGKICPQPKIISEKLTSYNSDAEQLEDCLHLNIWVPAFVFESGTHRPENLPVLFYIHGGWLQYGNANEDPEVDPRHLLSSDSFDKKFIIVAPAYRLNLFGFLHSKNLLQEKEYRPNLGFWDQRTALEWTYNNIKYFGGDPNNITVGGLSAGSYSTFFQLAYEAYHPSAEQIIKRVILISNCLAIQPKTLREAEEQFDELCLVLGVDQNLTSEEKILRLRSFNSTKLMNAILKLKLHTFRAITDNIFISSTLLQDIISGNYAKMLMRKKVSVLIGEVEDEPELYSHLNTPESVKDLRTQLENYYPRQITDTLLNIYIPEGFYKVIEEKDNFRENLRLLFGKIIADTQVYVSGRGFLYHITKDGSYPSNHIFRYHISYLPSSVEDNIAASGMKGVIHASDLSIWFHAIHNNFSLEEQKNAVSFMRPITDYIHGKNIEDLWGAERVNQYRSFNKDGSITIEDNPLWETNIKIYNSIVKAQIE